MNDDEERLIEEWIDSLSPEQLRALSNYQSRYLVMARKYGKLLEENLSLKEENRALTAALKEANFVNAL